MSYHIMNNSGAMQYGSLYLTLACWLLNPLVTYILLNFTPNSSVK